MFNSLLLGIMLGQSWLPGPDGVPVPDIPMFQEKGPPFVAPGSLFSVEVPVGWGVVLHPDDPYTLEFRAVGRPGNAVMLVRRMPVPKGANPRQLLINALERRLQKLPSFRTINRRDVKVAGHNGAALVGIYSYQGNVQYPIALEEVHLVTGGEAFVFHFECFEPEAGNLARDVNEFYTTFRPRPANASQGPFAPKEGPDLPVNPEAVPF